MRGAGKRFFFSLFLSWKASGGGVGEAPGRLRVRCTEARREVHGRRDEIRVNYVTRYMWAEAHLEGAEELLLLPRGPLVRLLLTFASCIFFGGSMAKKKEIGEKIDTFE